MHLPRWLRAFARVAAGTHTAMPNFPVLGWRARRVLRCGAGPQTDAQVMSSMAVEIANVAVASVLLLLLGTNLALCTAELLLARRSGKRWCARAEPALRAFQEEKSLIKPHF